MDVVLKRDAWVADSREQVERTWWPHMRRDHWFYFANVPRFVRSLEPTLTDQSEKDLSFDMHRGASAPR